MSLCYVIGLSSETYKMVCSHIFGQGSGYKVLTIIRLLALFLAAYMYHLEDYYKPIKLRRGNASVFDVIKIFATFSSQIIVWFSVFEG